MRRRRFTCAGEIRFPRIPTIPVRLLVLVLNSPDPRRYIQEPPLPFCPITWPIGSSARARRRASVIGEDGGRLVNDARTLERIRQLAIPPHGPTCTSPRARGARCRPGEWTRSRGSSIATTCAPSSADHSASTTVCASWPRNFPSCVAGSAGMPAARRRERAAVAAAVVRLDQRELLPHRQRAVPRGESHLRHRRRCLKRHVEIADGRATFTYVGKRSIRQRQIVANRSARAARRAASRFAGRALVPLFRWRNAGAISPRAT